MKKNQRFHRVIAGYVLLALSLGFSLKAIAQQPSGVVTAEVPPRTLPELQERISSLLDQPQFAAARWGVRIVNEQGGVVYDRDSQKAFMPASNMKLYTSAAALDKFGPDFRIATSVYATKTVGKGGILRGDLILYGRGDPSFSSRFDEGGDLNRFKSEATISAIEKVADQIKAKGIRRVIGDLIGDDSYFATDLLGAGWEWDDAQFDYGAEVSALTANDNIVTFTVLPGRSVGAPPMISIAPQTDYMTVVNLASTVDKGQTRIGVDRPLGSNTVEFFGTISRAAEKFEINIAVHDPARFAATLLREALMRRGIRVSGGVRGVTAATRLKSPFEPSRVIEIAKIVSPPLATLLKVVNKPSQNLHTELLLRQMGVQPGEKTLTDYGREKSTDSLGSEARRRFLQTAGIELDSLSLRDGSGLSRQDLVTPRATVQLLGFMRTHAQFEVFNESLPIAGVDGTLERRMRATSATRNVRAKTGTLSYVNALSGYLKTKGGQMLIFSLMQNNYTGPGREVTQIFDTICVLLADFEGQLE